MNRVLFGDCRESMHQLITGGVKVQCVVTSPPYWGLRSYLQDGHDDKHRELGLEARHDCLGWATQEKCGECHVCRMVAVFSLVRELLADDGTCWVNYGDSYATGAGRVGEHPGGGAQGAAWRGSRNGSEGKHGYSAGARGTGAITQPNRMPQQGLKPKDLVMMPARIALALQADGWWVRQDIVWQKPNPMPESVTDRCTKAHEYIFLLTKSERYFYDADAIKEPCSPGTHERYAQANGRPFGMSNWPKEGESHDPAELSAQKRAKYKTPDGWDTSSGEGGHGSFHQKGREAGFVGYETKGPKAALDQNDSAYGDGVSDRLGRGAGWRARKLAEANSGTKNNKSFDAAMAIMPEKRNKRSVWTIPTEPFSGAHFATFPTALVEPCILAGSRPGDLVFDPFFGSGTVGQVAQALGRNWLACELNEAYGPLQLERTAQTGLMFA